MRVVVTAICCLLYLVGLRVPLAVAQLPQGGPPEEPYRLPEPPPPVQAQPATQRQFPATGFFDVTAAPLPGAADWSQVQQQIQSQQQLLDQQARMLQEQQQQLKSLQEKVGSAAENLGEVEKSLEKTDSSLSGKAASGHSASKMKVSGRIHADYWGFPNDSLGANALETGNPLISPQDRIGFRRLRFGVAGDLPYNMLYKIEMEFAAGNDVEFRDAFLGWEDLPVLDTLLIGNQKRPYGLDHLNSSRYNVFMERPFIVEAFNQDARRLGMCSYGVSEDEAWNWRYGLFNQRRIQDEGVYIGDHLQGELAGRLANTIWYDETSDGRGYAHWAVSGSVAKPDGLAFNDRPGLDRAINEARFRTRPEGRTTATWLDTGVIAGADWYELLGLEGVINVGPLQVVGEYMNLWLQRDPGFGNQVHLHGGYAYISYFLTGEHIPWERDSGTLGRVKPFENFFLVDRTSGGVGRGLGALQVALRWSYADLTDENIAGGVGENLTFGLNWHWTPYARLQFNYIIGEIRDRRTVAGFDWANYNIAGVRAMVDF